VPVEHRDPLAGVDIVNQPDIVDVHFHSTRAGDAATLGESPAGRHSVAASLGSRDALRHGEAERDGRRDHEPSLGRDARGAV
jgi:hypothetical protein